MKLYDVDSSNISRFGYNGLTAVLEIHFKNGGIYQYYGVPVSVVLDFVTAPSKGQFLNSDIVGAYYFEKLDA